MSSNEWGIGVPGALGPEAIGALAAAAQQLGYRSFWFNCVAPDTDPAALLDAALARSKDIDVGIGVIPLDDYPSAILAARLAGGRANDPRVILGIGSGATRRGALQRVSDGIAQLRAALPRARVAVGGKGPRMVALAAPIADALLFSMLSPDEAQVIAGNLEAVGQRAASYGYHRVALDPGAVDRTHKEMVSHGVWPAAAAPPPQRSLLGTVLLSREETGRRIAADLSAYPADWRHALRPLPTRPSELDEWLDLFRLLVPANG